MILVIDDRKFVSKVHLHEYIKENLKFPDYYGNNLDALYDLLCVYSEPLEVEFIVRKENPLYDYLLKVIETFKDAAMENENIKIKWNTENTLKVISISEHPQMKDRAINYFQNIWASESSKMVYDDCINHCFDKNNPLPKWYLLMENDEIVGCAGLITNDFISRMDLYPWLCALYIEESYRHHGYGKLLIDQAKEDARKGGFEKIYLCTDHVGYYEHYDFYYIGQGYHPWNESSRIYCADLKHI